MAAKTCILIVHSKHGPAEVMLNFDDPSRRYSRKEAQRVASRHLTNTPDTVRVEIAEVVETVNR